MSRCVFFAKAGVSSERWTQAFPAAVIVDESQPYAVQDDELCWVMAGTEGWHHRIQQLAQQGVRTIVLSLQESRDELVETLTAGGRGYLHALAPITTLQAVAASVSNGGLWVGSDFVLDLVRGAAATALAHPEQPQDDALATLTSREREICLLVSEGLSNKEVARRVAITERTVKAHLGAAFEKLKVRDRMQLALLVNGARSPVWVSPLNGTNH